MTSWGSPTRLDRAPSGRDPQAVADAWERAVVIEVTPLGDIGAEAGQPAPIEAPGPMTADDVFLGWVDGAAWFARPTARIGGESITWREVSEPHADTLAAGVALVRWHALKVHCEACRAVTVPDLGGARRVCPECGQLAFPRTDPCVIVAITDDQDRLLLARSGAWPAGRMSVIAGFVEAGESAEQACHREVGEEVGLRLGRLSYVASQPWPMPRSLMLGYEARALDTQITIDGDEIIEARFFSRSDLAAALAADQVSLPVGSSIGRYLIERWLNSN